MKITEAMILSNVTRYQKKLPKIIPAIGISFFIGWLAGIFTLLFLLERVQ